MFIPIVRCRRVAPLLSGLLLTGSFFFVLAPAAHAQEETRKLRKSAPAEYPELARKYNLSGTVRLQLLVGPDGKVKEAKVLGGNAVLAKSFMDTVMKWEYEPAPHASTIVVTCDFKPHTPS